MVHTAASMLIACHVVINVRDRSVFVVIIMIVIIMSIAVMVARSCSAGYIFSTAHNTAYYIFGSLHHAAYYILRSTYDTRAVIGNSTCAGCERERRKSCE